MRYSLLALLPLAAAIPTQFTPRDDSLVKRESFSGRATFYDVGLGACGGYNVASDWIVALNTPQYGGGYPGPNCGKSITISYGGKTAVATIQDQCPSCAYGALDLSRGLFDYFSDESAGVFQMTWWYNDGSSSSNNNNNNQQQAAPTTTEQKYTPTSTTPAYTPPTSTYTPPTSTYVAPTSSETPSSSAVTSSSAGSSGSVTSSSSATTNSTTASASASASSAAQGSGSTSNLALINQAVAYYGNIIVTGAEVKAEKSS